jgi:hypothetical protein
VLGVVGDQGAEHDDPARHGGDPAQPLEQAARPWSPSPGGQAEQDRELGRLGAGKQEPRCGRDHHEHVKAVAPDAPVVLEMAACTM